LREERRLRMLESRVLRKTIWLERYEVTGEWRKPHNEELIDLTSSPNIFRVITSRSKRMVWACSTINGEEWCIQSFDGVT
jgi:hypothetical protein